MIVEKAWPKRRVEANILIDDRVAKEYVDNHGVFWVRLFACDVCLRSAQSPRANLQVESTFNATSTKFEEVEGMDPFGEKYTQKLPFTPFKVRVKVEDQNPSALYWVAVFVDGVFAQRLIFDSVNDFQRTFVGFAERPGFVGSERTFCFSMPRSVSGSSISTADTKNEAGCIRIDVHTTSRIRQTTENGSTGSANTTLSFQPLDKQAAKGLGSTAAVRPGSKQPSNSWTGTTIYVTPDDQNLVLTATIRYATTPKLQELGLIVLDRVQEPACSSVGERYSAEFMQTCMRHLFGSDFLLTPSIVSALNNLEGTFMPIMPKLRPPGVPVPKDVSGEPFEQSFLFNQVKAESQDDIPDLLKRKLSLVARESHGDKDTALFRAIAHQMFRFEGFYPVVASMLTTPQTCDGPRIQELANTLGARIIVWNSSSPDDKAIIVAPKILKFFHYCYAISVQSGFFSASHGKFWSLISPEEARVEDELRAKKKAKRRRAED